MISDIDGMSQIYGRLQQLSLSTGSVASSQRKWQLLMQDLLAEHEEDHVAKSARKRRARRKKSANHGKRPNA
jgi:hypothetical protein